MVPVYRTIFERNPEGPYWSFTSLENGIHSSYPGHGGYPASYDARTRIWYQRAKTLGRLCWSAPYVDVSSRRSVVTAACPVRRPDGQFAGVTAIDVTIADMLRQVTLPNAKSAVGRVVALVPRKGFDPGRIEMVNARDYPPDELGLLVVVQPSDEHRQGGWQAPPREMWLDVGDAAQHAEMIRDMVDDQPRVRRFAYEGRDTLWSYGRVLEDAYLIVNAPSDEMTAEAKEAEATVLTLTRSQMKLTASALGVVSLIVIALARVGSRTVTRPVRRLAGAAQRIAAGELDTRVEVRSRDELGELAQAFNDMVPHLQDRMKLRQSLSLAMEVQQHLLPAGPPRVEGLEIAGRSIYCDETGGDYYDFLDLSALGPHELGIAVGDVTGHGIAAALLMTSARALLRSHAGDAGTLADLMRDINRHLSADVPAGRFMTLYYMVIDGRRRTVRWANAGHDPPILYDPAADAFGELAGGNLPLGIMETEAYEEFRRDHLAPGQVLVVGTDGIWETHDPAGREFGKDALREIIRRHATEPAEAIGQAITAALESFRNGSPQEDDVTLVVVKVR